MSAEPTWSAPDQFPFTTATGTVYDIGDYHRALDLLLEASGYAGAAPRNRRHGDVPGPSCSSAWASPSTSR